MIVLIIISIIALYFTYLEQVGRNKNGLWIGMFIVTVIAAIHYNYGSDYPVYFSNYKEFITHRYSLGDIFAEDLDERAGEYGWLLLYWLVSPFGEAGFFVLVAFLSVFQGVVVYRLIKNYAPRQWMVFSLFIYLFNTSLYVGSMSGLRQNTAMAIVGFALPLILNRKVIYSILIIFLASTIHKSALVFIPFVFWGWVSFRSRKVIVVLFVSIALIFYIFKEYIQVVLDWFFLFEDFQMYQQYSMWEMNVTYGIGFLLSLIPIALSLFVIWKGNVTEDTLRIVSLASISYVLLPFVNNVGLTSRIAYYFDFFSVLSLPFCYASVKNKTARMALISLFVLLYVYSYYNYFFLPERYYSTYIYHSLLDLL